jgi:hypothetical protein
MAQAPTGKLKSPTNDDWSFAIRMLKSEDGMADIDFDSLQNAVAEAANLVDQIEKEKSSRPTHTLAKRKLGKLQRLLEALEYELKIKDTQQSLKETGAARHMAQLLSSSAVEQISEDLQDGVTVTQSRKPSPEERKAALEGMPSAAMLFAIQQIKEPVDDWISRNAKNTGGRPINTPRQAILFCLMKNYEAIMNEPLQTESKRHLAMLATHIVPACKASTSGVEDACERAFKEFASWVAWHNFPPPTVILGPVDIEAIPDDQEAPLVPAKPRSKK